MKSDNDMLKHIFRENLGKGTETPDFESMWRRATEQKRIKRIWVWKVAAGIALIAIIGLLVTFSAIHVRPTRDMQISAWKEPTRFLVPPVEKDTVLMALTRWSSPTSSLIPKNRLKENKTE